MVRALWSSRHRRVWPALFLLGGCGGVQAARGHDQVAALVAERSGGARTRWQDGPPPEARIADWVRSLLADGLTRERAVEIALVNNPALKETYEHLGVSQADMVQAGLLRNPTFGLDLGFGTGTLGELRGSVVQDFLDLIVLGRRKEIAREQFLSDTLRVAHQALETAAMVSRAFVDVQTQEAVVAQRRVLLDTQGLGAALMERRHAAGNATDLERAEEDASLAEARLELNRDELELVERREHLNQLLGLSGASSAWTVREPLAEPMAAEPALATLEASALKRRLDVAAAGGQAVLLAKATALARSTRAIGRLDIGVDAHQDPDGPRVIGPNLVIELPIFDQRQATIARLYASQREAERHHERVVGDVRAEVRVAHARTAAAREVVAHYHDTLLPLRRSVVELTQQAFNGMLIGAPRLLEAKRAELDAHRGYLAALGAYWTARAELERATASRLDTSTSGPMATAGTDRDGGKR